MELDAALEVEAGDPQIAIDFLVDNINLSKSRLKELMRRGGVWRVTRDGHRERLHRAMTDISVGEQIEIFYDEALFSLKPLQPELVVDAGQYTLWNKPTDASLHGNDWTDYHSFSRAVELKLDGERPIFWLNNLDYQASGLTLLAHSRKAAAELTEQLDNLESSAAVVKYRAVVYGQFVHQGRVSTELMDGAAISEFSPVRYDARPDRTILDIQLVSALPDQAQRQCKSLGHSIVGDEMHDHQEDQELADGSGLQLKLTELAFQCPVEKKPMRFSLFDENR